jgi:hypothetical protein
MSRVFWVQVGERAVGAAAAALLSLWAVGDGFNLLHVNWNAALGVAGGAALASVLKSLLAANVGPADTPSLVPVAKVSAGR